MPSQPKPAPKKVGRPALPKGHAKSGAIQVRLNDDDRKRVELAAKKSKQTVSEWIRSTINMALEA
jgi:predicted HicB family RNase H-like nuclease